MLKCNKLSEKCKFVTSYACFAFVCVMFCLRLLGFNMLGFNLVSTPFDLVSSVV